MDRPRSAHIRLGMFILAFSLFVGAVLATILRGCAGNGIYPVEGKVVWKNGTPATELAGSHVILDHHAKRTGARGIVQADGTFRLTTHKTNDGALAGDYQVLIVEAYRKSIAPVGDDPTNLEPTVSDSRYADPSTSDLYTTIIAGTNYITLVVDRNPVRK